MLVREAIAFLLGNLQVPLLIIAIVTTVYKIRTTAARHEVVTPVYVLWGEVVFYCVGIAFVYFWALHAFAGKFIAPMIGWLPSPFEWELAWAELGIGVIALLSLWRGYEMRLAATLAYAIFSFGAAAQHIHLMLSAHNYAPGNAGFVLWFGDLALPIALLLLCAGAADAYERTALRRTHR